MNGELRIDAMMRSIDVYGRLAFGGQCVAAMAMIAVPALLVVASVLPFYRWDNDRGEALLILFGGWALAVGVGAAAVVLALFCWRFNGDWITEWPGYATGFGIAGVANAVLAFLLTSTPVPIYLSFLVTMAAACAAGMVVAGHLGGAQVLPEQRRRAIARRR